MSLADFLEKIQNKPRSVRVMIMWVGVAIFMTLFLILWVATIDSGQGTENLASEYQFEQEVQPFSEAKEEIPSLWQSLKASVSGLFESFNEETGKESTDEMENASEVIDENAVPPSALP